MEEKFVFTIDAMGIQLSIKIYEDLELGLQNKLKEKIENFTHWFDNTFSRFKADSLVTKLSKEKGIHNVPYELVEMLKIYKTFETVTSGIMNPFIGGTLVDLGYDAEYSLTKKENIGLPKKFEEYIEIIDEQNIKIKELGMIDLGALGKGYWVDKVKQILESEGVKNFLVDGSGDIYFSGDYPITVGLENPFNMGEVIGTIKVQNQSICGSAINKRAWANTNHVVNAVTGESANVIVATWVLADDATYADALATALFFMEPNKLKTQNLNGEFLIIYKDKSFLKSENFQAEMFN